jgi:hypothetical protein
MSARNLLPKSGIHRALTQDAGVEERSVCLYCWHFRRVVALEDEFHVACVCPAYSQPRHDMLNSLPSAHRFSSCADLVCGIAFCYRMLLCTHPPDTQAAAHTRVRKAERQVCSSKFCLQACCLAPHR